ncbi:hypothetical protein [Pectobacterium versatile]|uniref:hypothetical protein n=1 Tax=Pectobacterium versatile TaxID=2488639 RepID=UPI003015EEDF
MRYLWATVIALTLIGCDSVEEKIKRNAKISVAERLKDPESAKFSDLYIIRGERDVAVCGSVNGKNSFGAYTGSVRFVVSVQEDKFVITGGVLEDDESRRATVASNNTGNPESVFEKIFWNALCIDEIHPKTFTGEKW